MLFQFVALSDSNIAYAFFHFLKVGHLQCLKPILSFVFIIFHKVILNKIFLKCMADIEVEVASIELISYFIGLDDCNIFV